MGASESKPQQKQRRIKEHAEELEKSGFQESDEVDTTDGKTVKESEPHFHDTDAASQSDPQQLYATYMLEHSGKHSEDAEALKINPATLQYPFENIVLEGGGTKGMAYVGALKCLEDLGMINQIKRIAGTSVGGIAASLLAFGYTSDELLEALSQDLESLFNDHSWGYFSLLPNLIRTFGWNPGNKVHDWFGNAFLEKTGNPDTTFLDLYKIRGVELCIVVTNLNLMTAEYCHAKTTPNMPIRDALRMTMAIPGVFSASHYDNHGVTDVYVDGGVLVNYPINCFDGWYLSLAKSDAFLSRMKSLEDLQSEMAPCNRFRSTGPNKTMGFLLYEESEREVMRFDLEKRYGSLMPTKPTENTKLWIEREKKKQDQIKAQKAHCKIVNAVDNFLNVLFESNDKDAEYITKDELQEALNSEAFKPKNKELIFGKDCDIENVFDILDADGNNKISFHELINFIEEAGIRMQNRVQGYKRRPVNNLHDFLMALQETIFTNLKYTSVNVTDTERTVGINTGHISTLDYVLEEADKDFVIKRGYNATMSFLRYYALNHPDEVKSRDVPVTAQSQQPASIHSNGDDLNEVGEKNTLLEDKKET